jgi:hypothetical protein
MPVDHADEVERGIAPHGGQVAILAYPSQADGGRTQPPRRGHRTLAGRNASDNK